MTPPESLGRWLNLESKPMARLIVSTLMSLDGFCAGPGGQLGGMPMDAAFDAHNLERMRHAGTLLFGRTTFGMFKAFWPEVRPGDERFSPIVREIAALVAGARKLVVSDTLVPDPLGPWREAELVRRKTAHVRLRELKAAESRDLLLFGSPVLAADLLKHGLVDEVHALVGPVLLGEGVRLFEPGVAAPLSLLDHERLAGSGTVRMRYAAA
jgi:dihydrofolate reductase